MTTTAPSKHTDRRFYRSSATKPRIERRGEGEDAPAVIVGYAAVFYRADDAGTEYQLWRDGYERIMPGAFDEALQEDLVRGLTNHDSNWLLGRSDKDTLRLSVDKIGLRYEIDPPDTQAGRDTLALLQRGDLDGSSFGFRVYGKRGTVKWVDETRDGRTIEVREIHACELLDVGPVTFPAYTATEAGARSEELPAHLREARDDWQRWKRAATADDIGRQLDLTISIVEADSLL